MLMIDPDAASPQVWDQGYTRCMRGMGRTAIFVLAASVLLPASVPARVDPVRKPGPVAPVGATVTASTRSAGAKNVTVTLILRYEMQCGSPGAGPVVVTLPAAEQVPASLPRRSVLVAGKPGAVSLAGHRVSVALPKPPQILCDVLGPGTLPIVFTRAAGLGNPAQPGTYTFTAVRAKQRFSARLTIR